jgi:hypothetical protein
MAVSKREVDCGIASWDGIGYWSCDLVQWDVIHAKSPHEVIDVVHVLLMRLWGEQGLEQPFAAMDLADMP